MTSIDSSFIDAAVAQALRLDLKFLDGPGHTRHVPFAVTPTPLPGATWAHLQRVAPLLGRMTQAIAADSKLISEVHGPLVDADPFFAEMLATHEKLHAQPGELARLPLLLQRSDFIIDEREGARLVECNSIAAGMAPFGERTGMLHDYLHGQWAAELAGYWPAGADSTIPNPATDRMARAIAAAAQQVCSQLGDRAPPGFLMVVQENEDNVFDQHLLEARLRELGITTWRRTFRQLHGQLGTGANDALLLEGCGEVHVVYLRAGYQYLDYVARDLDARRCCDALTETRIFIERHRVAINATVAQQLATSKRMQLHLACDEHALLAQLGFDTAERQLLQSAFTDMRYVDAHSAVRLRDDGDVSEWVLKNQGEGGGHCLFEGDILAALDKIPKDGLRAWTLMRRLRPTGRDLPTLLVRDRRAQVVEQLASEIGLFTAHLGDAPLLDQDGYVGYLVRSKPPQAREGGVHSGSGALDSLVLRD